MTRNNVLLLVTVGAIVVALSAIKAVQLHGGATGLSRAKPMVLSTPIPHPYCTAVANGGEAFAKEHGIDLRVVVSRDGVQGTISSDVESMFTLGHKAFAIYPVDPAGSKGLFGRLSEHGCFVVAYGAQPAPGTAAPFAVATDTQAAATTAAEKLIDLMGGQGKIIDVLESLTDANTTIRRAAVEAVVKKHPGVSIVLTVGDVTTEEAAREKIEGALVARGYDVDGVICTGYTTTVAAAGLLKEYHAKPGVKRIRFVGLDDDKRVLAAIRDGSIDATLAQNPFGHGYISCALLQLLMEGWKPKVPYQFIDSGCIVVTKENVDTFGPKIEEVTKGIVADLKTKYFEPAK
jgi:ribose transport system substrate-binding protein